MALVFYFAVAFASFACALAIEPSFANEKDESKYAQNEVFLISNTDWRSVLSLVPVTTWTPSTQNKVGGAADAAAGGGDSFASVIAFPSLVFHQEGSNFDADGVIQFMQQYWSGDAVPVAKRLTLVGSAPTQLTSLLTAARPNGAGLKASEIRRIQPSDFTSFWRRYDDVVAVDYYDYAGALVASEWASLINAPLVFVSGMRGVVDSLKGKNVFFVSSADGANGCSGESCPESYYPALEAAAGAIERLSVQEVQEEYVARTNTRRVVLVHPRDKSVFLEGEELTPERGGGIVRKLMGEHSLAAPFLAAAKKEVIILSHAPSPSASPNENFDFVRAEIAVALDRLFWERGRVPQYLTVAASPEVVTVYYNFGGNRVAAQYGYATASRQRLLTGLVSGATVSDVSSLVARSVFFNALINRVYGGEAASGVAKAGAPEVLYPDVYAQQIALKTAASGYSTKCFTSRGNLPPCSNEPRVNASVLSRRGFYTFSGHGSGAYGGFYYFELPWLDLTWGFANSCGTNDYDGYKQDTFGWRMLRRGAIAYHGAVQACLELFDIELSALKFLTQGTPANPTLGELNERLYADPAYLHYRGAYFMLGDPTLAPKFKRVDWSSEGGVKDASSAIGSSGANAIFSDASGAAVAGSGNAKTNANSLRKPARKTTQSLAG
ncbi:MAG: hypothetical protein QW343_02735 [Candidatus Norongarragalinales archaeon]